MDLYDRSWLPRNRRDFLRVAAGLGSYLLALPTLSPSLFSQARDYGPPAWIPLEELEQRLQQLGRRHPDLMNPPGARKERRREVSVGRNPHGSLGRG